MKVVIANDYKKMGRSLETVEHKVSLKSKRTCLMSVVE